MIPELVKAEILWTRKCPIRCSYCAMVDYPEIRKAPLELMLQGVDRLHALGCGFFAIYGASPLYDFEGLPQFVEKAEGLGILTTVIADGVDAKSFDRLEELYAHGLRSLTVSYDGSSAEENLDKAVRLKGLKGLELLKKFRMAHSDLRDVQITATVTKMNWRGLLEILEPLTSSGIWFSFDFVHPDRGQPGTKCKGDASGLKFEPGDELSVVEFAQGLLFLKKAGVKVHQSEEYLQWCMEHPGDVTSFRWSCARTPVFPAWLTIDADGTVLPCDDFAAVREFKVWDLDEGQFVAFSQKYKDEVLLRCPGCAWSTHWDAVRIKERGASTSSFFHLGAHDA